MRVDAIVNSLCPVRGFIIDMDVLVWYLSVNKFVS
jgi:hypothetical protein